MCQTFWGCILAKLLASAVAIVFDGAESSALSACSVALGHNRDVMHQVIVMVDSQTLYKSASRASPLRRGAEAGLVLRLRGLAAGQPRRLCLQRRQFLLLGC